jgi:hypothetical protein
MVRKNIDVFENRNSSGEEMRPRHRHGHEHQETREEESAAVERREEHRDQKHEDTPIIIVQKAANTSDDSEDSYVEENANKILSVGLGSLGSGIAAGSIGYISSLFAGGLPAFPVLLGLGGGAFLGMNIGGSMERSSLGKTMGLITGAAGGAIAASGISAGLAAWNVNAGLTAAQTALTAGAAAVWPWAAIGAGAYFGLRMLPHLYRGVKGLFAKRSHA